MKFVVDFDGTVVREDRPYDDLKTPLEFVRGSKRTLLSLKRAGHVLILASGRASIALRKDWMAHPLWRQDLNPPVWWEKSQPLNEARYQQMIEFVRANLSGVFDAIDDGSGGKLGGDIYIDDRAYPQRDMEQVWVMLERQFGEPVEEHATT